MNIYKKSRQEKPAFANVACDDGPNFEAVDIPCLDAVRGGALAVDGAHLYVAVGCTVAVEAYGEASSEVECQVTEGETLGSGEAETKVQPFIISSSIWYRMVTGQKIEADCTSYMKFEDKQDGWQITEYEVCLSSFEVMEAVKKISSN